MSGNLILRFTKSKVKHYDEYVAPKPHPLELKPQISLFDIIRIDEERNSITIFMELFMNWNDTRILLTAKNESS